MLNFYRRLLFIIINGVMSFHVAMAAPSTEIFHRSFWQPYYHGQRLNYCTLEAKECGLPVATRYCRMMGYARADQQIIANNVGLTNYISVPAKCVGWQCNGFKSIRCVGKITHKPPKSYHYRLKRFVLPRYNNYRVDWCYDGQHRCGKAVAYSFCRRMGYMQQRGFAIQTHVPATQAIGNQKLCFGPQCKAFEQITCFR